MPLEYKRIPFDLREVKAADSGGWEIAGYASTWWGSPDAYGDVIAPGAFAASIAERETKFLFEHHTPIGKQLELREDDHGLWGRWSVVDTTTGTDAYKLAKAGVLDSLSIGYVTEDAEFKDDGTRVLKRVTLFEVSAVSVPANANAVITGVKSFADQSQDVRVAVSEWLERVKSGSDTRRAEGKDISQQRRDQVAAVSGSLRAAADAADALIAPPAPPEFLNLGMELRRRRLTALGIDLERPA